jgi:uncharacterized protein (DUF952 family)
MTFHLTTMECWERQKNLETYVPDAFANEGFIHCTDGQQNMIDTANRYYANDPATFICLEIDPARVSSEIRYEDPAHIYPHIYGPLNTEAVIAIRSMIRNVDGRFVRLGDVNSA